MRGNRIEAREIDELYDAFRENETLFNIDLRENPGLNDRMARTFALKMLANYTKVSNQPFKDYKAWQREAKYFNAQLLVVEIPQEMV
jgi:hypothetical protein